jgi:putative transcriptional regulator
MIGIKCNLRSVLRKRGIVQTWLCEQVEISNAQMSRIVNGMMPRLDLAYRIADALELTVYDIWEIEKSSEGE